MAKFIISEIKMDNFCKLLFSVVYCQPDAKKPNEFFNQVAHHLPTYNHIIITVNTDSRYLMNKLNSLTL